MKKVLTMLIAAFSVCYALSSCQKQDSPTPSVFVDLPGDSDIPIVLSAEGFSADSQTRAVTETTDLNSFIVSATLDTPSVNTVLWTNAYFNKSGSKYYSNKYWPATGTGMKFWASNESMVFDNATNGYYINAVNTADMVVAYEDSPVFQGANKLKFRHIFARLGYCKINVTNGYTITDLTIKMTPNTGGRYYLSSGTWTSTVAGSEKTIATALNSETSLNEYLVPGTYRLDASYKATKGDSYEKTFSLSTDVTLVAGAVNNISGSVTGDAV